MNNPALQQEKKAIDQLIDQIGSFSGDPFIASQLTYYLCIRISGFIETCVRTIFMEYCSPRIRDNVSNFIDVQLRRSRNPSYESICNLTKEFDKEWVQTFKAAVTVQNRDALQSINVNRNNIAHGETSNITLRQLTDYYDEAIDLLNKLEKTCV